MDRILQWLGKLLLLIILGPVILGLALQVFVGLATAVLPWLIVLALIAGVAAGLSAGLVVRRRLLPPGQGSPLPPGGPALGPWRVRRSRSRRT